MTAKWASVTAQHRTFQLTEPLLLPVDVAMFVQLLRRSNASMTQDKLNIAVWNIGVLEQRGHGVSQIVQAYPSKPGFTLHPLEGPKEIARTDWLTIGVKYYIPQFGRFGVNMLMVDFIIL